MTDQVRPSGAGHDDFAARDEHRAAANDTINDQEHRAVRDAQVRQAARSQARPEPDREDLSPEPHFEEGIVDDVSNLVDDGVSYAQAEIAFQKTRAALAGKSAGFAAGYLIVALIVFHIALLALAVGLVMALEPLVTIWGAIAIVVGILLLIAGWLALKAKRQGERISGLFANDSAGGTQ